MKLTYDAWLRAAKCIAVCILAIALPWMVYAQAVSTTTVQGTVYLANGQPGAGTLQLSWPAFTTAASQAIAAGRITVAIGADGFVSVNLAPNLGSSPAGLYYTAVYDMSDGTTSTEYWVVPAATQATIAQVRAQVMPAAQALQAVSKAYVDQAIQSAALGALSPSGGTLTGPLYLSGDPTQTMQAADKHYVDITFSQAVPLTGGTLTGPINAPAVTASVNGQINIMAPGLGASDNTCTGDDTAALLAAQTLAKTFAVNGVRPATIYFPPGCYNISATSGWWQGVSMTGGGSPSSNGNHGAIIRQTVPGADVISAVDPSLVTSTYFNSSWSISHLTLVVNDGASGSHPHRWPGRWFDDASMTAGSAILKTTNGGVTCGDTGQAIQVNGAGAAGANLVTTILSVSPCWAQSGNSWQSITLAASAGTTVTNAHTYISVANLPVTANIGAAGIALDGYDGKQADWPAGSVNTSSSYSHINDVTIVSASYANHGQNNSVGIYTQGYNINYALKVRNSNFNRLTFGIVQQTAELNSFSASSNGDYQSWRDIQTNGDDVPFIASNGETATLDNWENNSDPIGFQVYRMPNSGGDTPDGWVLSNISGGGSSGTTLGWNIAGNDWTVTDVALGNNAYIDTTYSAFTNVLGYQPNFGGNSNTFLGGNQFTGTPVNGSLGSVATALGVNSLGMPNSKYFPMTPYKGSNHLAGRVTADFISDGNPLTAPYNHDDLFLWPQDMMYNNGGSATYSTYFTTDSTAVTGATWNFVNPGSGGSNFQQFDGPGGTGGILVIGTNVPQKNLDITLSAKCDSSTTYGFKAAVFNGTATHTITGSCTTAFQTYQFVLPITSADLTHNLYFAGTTANNFRVQWIDIQPQTNSDTSTQLAATPTLCPSGQAPTGILPNGNATGCASSGATWGSVTGTLSSQTDLNTALALKAPLASPALTGTPTAPTHASCASDTQIATGAYVAACGTGGTSPYAGVTSNGASGLSISGQPGNATDALTVGSAAISHYAQQNPYCQVLNVFQNPTNTGTSTEFKCENFIYWQNSYTGQLTWVNETGPDDFGACNSKYAVDSVNGLDTNAGTCAAPFQTIAKLNTVTFAAGDSVGFAANSRWREEGFSPNSTANLTLAAYGKGSRPFIDGSNDIPNASFALNSGDTYTYTVTAPITAFTVGTIGFWENNTRLAFYNSVANVEANAGSYYYSQATCQNNTSTTCQFYVHPLNSTDAITDSNLYTYTRYHGGIRDNGGSHWTVSGLEIGRHEDESVYMADILGSYLHDVLVEGYSTHAMYTDENDKLVNMVFEDGYDTTLGGSGGPQPIINYFNPAGGTMEFDGVIVIQPATAIANNGGCQAAYGHTPSGTDPTPTVSYTMNYVKLFNCVNGWADTDDLNAYYNGFESHGSTTIFPSGISSAASVSATVNGAIVDDIANTQNGVVFQVAGTKASVNGLVAVQGNGYGYGIQAGAALASLSVTNSSFSDFLASSAITPVYSTAAAIAGFSSSGNSFSGAISKMYSFSNAPTTGTSDYNAVNGLPGVTWGGTTYTYPNWVLAGYDTHTGGVVSINANWGGTAVIQTGQPAGTGNSVPNDQRGVFDVTSAGGSGTNATATYTFTKPYKTVPMVTVQYSNSSGDNNWAAPTVTTTGITFNHTAAIVSCCGTYTITYQVFP